MEVSLIEEEAKIEEVKGHRALKYQVIKNGKNINKVPVYIQWLNSVKIEKGENGIVTYCKKCHLFFYFEDMHEKLHEQFHKNCDIEDIFEFYDNCGEFYNEYSICCFKQFCQTSIRKILAILEDFVLWIILIPALTFIITVMNFFPICYSKRINKKQDINYINFIFDSEYYTLFSAIIITIYSLYCLVYLIPYHAIYFFHLYFILKRRSEFLREMQGL